MNLDTLYLAALIGLPVLGVAGFVAKTFVWPSVKAQLIEVMSRNIGHSLEEMDKSVSNQREDIQDLNRRLTQAETRYDDAISDLRRRMDK